MTEKRRPAIWTVPDIQRLPEFGSAHGWFYGLVRDGTRIPRFSEILPGMGYTRPFWRDVACHPGRALRDLWRYRPPVSSVLWNTTSTNTTYWVNYASATRDPFKTTTRKDPESGD